MTISEKDWQKYIERLSSVNKQAADLIKDFIDKNGVEDRKALIDYAYRICAQYSNASASLTALMYDTVAELEKVLLPSAELATLPKYGEVAKTINGVLKTSENAEEISSAVGRLVKRTGQDTLLQNALRDKAQFAWIPSGDTCAFCIMLAGRGWQNMSKSALKGGHAEHIHSNCDCTYMIRHRENFDVSGYDPEKYKKMYYDADGTTTEEKLNSMRRKFYAENREEILEQKASAYEKRKELNDSSSEETNVN